MIKVSPSIIKTSAVGLLVLGAVNLKAKEYNKDYFQVSNPNRTELISEEGANALKTYKASSIEQAETPSVHLEELDIMIKKFIEDENDRKNINALTNNFYSKFGTYLGTAYIQHELNTRVLYTFMTGNTELLRKGNIAPKFADKIDGYGEDFYKTVKPNAGEVLKWATGMYTSYIANKLQFDHKPSANEVIRKIDEIIKNESILTDEEKKDIFIQTDIYKSSVLNGKTDIKSNAKLIASKIHAYDMYMFWHELRNVGVNSSESFKRSDKNIKSFFKEWMMVVYPQFWGGNL